MMVWGKLGEEEPYWSVLTSDEYKMENLNSDVVENFYNSGRYDTSCIGVTLIRNGRINNLNEMKNLDIVEIGCGCGRITKSLAENFRKVIAVDISKGNLEIAKQHIMDENVEFRQISKVEDYNTLPIADVIYTIIVLQHNCPPVIEYIIDAMPGRLRDSGIAMFQVPTYKKGYTFEYEKYVEEMMGRELEMHLLPQKRIFEIAYKNNCIPLEVYPNNSTGNADNSTMFVLEKRNGTDDF
ncbi:MAG: class I SAM-dependent methyltransferase [Lachnospiraceae bacterium]|nr:class I SAM-dependent methyltransferase [Lachnospiraceae bacterium]